MIRSKPSTFFQSINPMNFDTIIITAATTVVTGFIAGFAWAWWRDRCAKKGAQ